MSNTTVLIEPNRLFRQGLSYLLKGTPFEIAAEHANVAGLLDSERADPGLVQLVIIDNPEDASDLIKIRTAFPASKIVVLASSLKVDHLRDVMKAGVDGFLIKDLSPEALIQSLQLVMLGEKVYPTDLASLLINSPAPSFLTPQRGLTAREVDILRYLITGASNKVIAHNLSITEATVKVHLKTLLRKIDANNRTQAAIWAINNGYSAATTDAPSRSFQMAS